MDWIQGVGLADVADGFFQKLSSAVNLLATPRETLLQVCGELSVMETSQKCGLCPPEAHIQ